MHMRPAAGGYEVFLCVIIFHKLPCMLTQMPSMPSIYQLELVNLIKAMLNKSPEKRPTINRILRDPYIKENIARFLEGTRPRLVLCASVCCIRFSPKKYIMHVKIHVCQ